MSKKNKVVLVLLASVVLIYGLIMLRKDLASQNFNWTAENIVKYSLITLTSVGLYAWTYERKK